MSEAKGAKEKRGLYHQYQTILEKYPLMANAFQGGIITAIGVLISQSIMSPIGEPTAFDWREVQVMTFINMAWITPVLLWFFCLLTKMKRGPMYKLLIDQFVFSPVFPASIIALRNVLYEGGDLAGVPKVIVDVVPGVQLTAWLFWIPTRFLIIKYVPNTLALLANSGASLVWTIIFVMTLNK
eukprot:gene14171-16504_t